MARRGRSVACALAVAAAVTAGGASSAEAKVWGVKLNDCSRFAGYTNYVFNTHTPNRNQCVAAIQHFVNAVSFFGGVPGAGPVDGNWGPQTDAAVIRYKQRVGQPATATADARVLYRMYIGCVELASKLGLRHHAIAACTN